MTMAFDLVQLTPEESKIINFSSHDCEAECYMLQKALDDAFGALGFLQQSPHSSSKEEAANEQANKEAEAMIVRTVKMVAAKFGCPIPEAGRDADLDIKGCERSVVNDLRYSGVQTLPPDEVLEEWDATAVCVMKRWICASMEMATRLGKPVFFLPMGAPGFVTMRWPLSENGTALEADPKVASDKVDFWVMNGLTAVRMYVPIQDLCVVRLLPAWG